ncbi:MAG TPA: hypothetical protein VG650_12180 [Mycobacteriales bacterium]|nr:hypothetical protein [Mycobacteriales bacterium]
MPRALPTNRFVPTVALGGSLILAAALVAAPTYGAHAVNKPSISHLKVAHAARHSLTVSVSGNASRFRVYVGHRIKDVAVAHLSKDAHSAWTRSHEVTVTGLKYSTAPYYYRVVAEAGSRHAYSLTEGPVGLEPAKPTNLTVASQNGAPSLSWDSGSVTGYQVVEATNPQLSDNRQIITMHGVDQQFTPPQLSSGATYYFAVRSRNGTTNSGWSAPVNGALTGQQQAVSAMTYNIREAKYDNEPDGSNHGASWDQRKGPAAALIRSAMPDVIAIEEGASFVDGSSTERQVDSLTSALGSPYRLARTEIPPTEKHYFRTGDYVIYNSDKLATVGQGGHWDTGEANLGPQHSAAYQEFRVISSGARFVFVAFHLVQKNDNPATDDAARQRQATSMIRQAHSAFPDLPIVYGGDTNSALEKKHVIDSARVAARAFKVDDAFDAAQTRHHTKYNSANGYNRKPPAFSDDIDAIFTEPGIGVSSWDELLNLSHGKFVLPIPSDHNPIVAGLTIPY